MTGINHTINWLVGRYEISRPQARKLLNQALLYRVVIDSLEEQTDFLVLDEKLIRKGKNSKFEFDEKTRWTKIQ